MFFIQLLVVFSTFLPTQQVEKDCGDLLLDLYYNGTAGYRLPPGPCTRTSLVRFSKRKAPGNIGDLGILNSLQIIDSSSNSLRHLISLHIEGTNLKYYPDKFLPNLERIIPAPNSTNSAIVIRKNNNLCLPANVTEKLLDMVDGQGYIESCTCTAQDGGLGEYLRRTAVIEGGDVCRILRGNLVFHENSTMNEKMRRQLETVEELHGFIAILKTNFTSLDFLKNLKRVFTDHKGGTAALWIFKNKKLKSLGFLLDTVRDTRDTDVNRGYSLVKITHNSLLKISQIEREYYTTFFTTEMDMTSDADPIKIDQYYCALVEPIRENLDSIEDCTHVTGNLTIGSSFDGFSPERMDNIFGYLRVLEGCLTIRDTEFTNLTFLHDFTTVNCKADRPAVIIEDNPKLKFLDIQIQEFGESKKPVTIKLTNNPKLCGREVDYLKAIMNSAWRLIEFDRWDKKCRDVRLYSTSRLPYYYVSGAGILVVGMIVLEVVVQLIRRKKKKKKAARSERSE